MNYKRGDFVATHSGFYVMIIKEPTNSDNSIIYVGCDLTSIFFTQRGWFSRRATKEEKSRLIWLLSKKGYTWDEENLELTQEL